MATTVLVAGSTGYLGKFAVRGFKQRGFRVRALTHSEERLGKPRPFTAPAVADGVDVVFSSIGISRQRDGLKFEQVDHQANRLLVVLAKQSGVQKFVYVSLWGQAEIQHLEIVRAHEKVVRALEESGLAYCVVRPSGYFSHIDLAEVCVDAVASDAPEIGAGGPETMTQPQAAELAFDVLGRPPKIVVLPMWLMRGGVRLIGLLNKQFGDLFEFIVTAGKIDGVAPSVGKTTLRSYFEELAEDR